MKQLLGLFAIFFITSFVGVSVVNADEDCIGQCYSDSNFDILHERSLRNLEQLNNIVEKNKTRVNLVDAKVTYSFAGIGVGKASIYLMVKDGKLVDFNIDATVGVLGVKEDIKQKVTIDRLLKGDALQFYMRGADKPVLRVLANKGFGEQGGSATIEIWDGKKYRKELITIGHIKGDEYKLYLGAAQATNEVTDLSINISGMSIKSMHVSSYKIKTK